MTQEELDRYEELTSIFNKRCIYIVERLGHYFPDEDWCYLYDFMYDEGDVKCTGSDRYDDYCEYFPKEYLTMTDEELEEVLSKKKQEAIAKELAKMEERRKNLEEHEKAEYLRLKEKYGRSVD